MKKSILIPLFGLSLLCLQTNAQVAWLDTGFGANGITLATNQPNIKPLRANMTMQPDGKVLVRVIKRDTITNVYTVWLHRFGLDGDVDTGFGQNGQVLIDTVFWDTEPITNDANLLPDGKILLATPTSSNNQLFTIITRLNPDGSPDEDFSVNGRLKLEEIIDINGLQPRLVDLEVQPNGRIVLIYNSYYSLLAEYGFRILKPNGDILTGYEEIVWGNTDIDEYMTQAIVLPDGKILIGGKRDPISGQPYGTDFALQRFDVAGFADEDFGNTGIALADYNDQQELMTDMLLEPDGGIVTVGTTNANTLMLARFTADGDLDDSFGVNGVSTFPNLPVVSSRPAMSRGTDGKLVVAGGEYEFNTLHDEEASIARFLPNGEIDVTFGALGVVYLPPAATGINAIFQDVAVLPDRRILTCGIRYNGENQLLLARFMPDTNVVIWYHDQDGDSYGNAADTVFAFDAPPGYVANADDCDDANPAVNPEALEICGNNIDENCDGILATDTVAPLAVCLPQVKYYMNEIGLISIAPESLNDGSTDNCATNLHFSSSITQLTCSDPPVQMALVTVTDDAGNSSTCNTLIKFTDTLAPVAICVPVITLAIGPFGQPAIITPEDIDNGSYDNCGPIIASWLDKTQFTCADLGVQQVTLTVVENGSLTSTCTALVKVKDVNAPIAICAQQLVVGLDQNGVATLTPDALDQGSYDNCSDTLMKYLSKTDFSCAELGIEQPVVLAVEDVYFNRNECTTMVTIVDKIKPVQVCDEVSTVSLDANGEVQLQPAVFNDGSYDNCSGGLTFALDISNFDCDDLGDHLVITTCTDESGNESTCQTILTVQDKLPPVMWCVDSLTIELDDIGLMTINPADLDNGSTDNCGIVVWVVDPPQLSALQIGVNEVTLTGVDTSENAASCVTVVTLVGGEVSIQELPAEAVSLTPNPTNGFCYLHMQSGRQAQKVELFNAAGQWLWSENGAFSALNLDFSAQPAGTYYLRVQSDQFARMVKVVLVK